MEEKDMVCYALLIGMALLSSFQCNRTNQTNKTKSPLVFTCSSRTVQPLPLLHFRKVQIKLYFKLPYFPYVLSRR